MRRIISALGSDPGGILHYTGFRGNRPKISAALIVTLRMGWLLHRRVLAAGIQSTIAAAGTKKAGLLGY
jgi:hypothetical protein